MPIDLSSFAEIVNSALADSSPCVVATVGDDGVPDIGYKGSLMVLDQDHLAYWERTRGVQLANLRNHPGVAALYFNRQRGKYLRFFGQAELYESGPERDQIMAKVVQPELDRDPERKGIAVRIRVDRLEDPFGGASQRRD